MRRNAMILCMSNFRARFLFHYGVGPHFSIPVVLCFKSSGSYATFAAMEASARRAVRRRAARLSGISSFATRLSTQ